MLKIDEIDLKIIDVLKENCRLSTRKIAKKTLVPIATVYNRIKKLEAERVIKKYSVVIDNKKVDKPLAAHILINYDISRWGKESKERLRNELKKHLTTLKGVETVDYITGRFDIHLKVRVKDMDELNGLLLDNLRNIPGIGQTESFFVLEEVK
ncbi:MAG: Lrp/AsnC family transcriptional regulator [Candidatus Woesearchaeota archaeon]